MSPSKSFGKTLGAAVLILSVGLPASALDPSTVFTTSLDRPKTVIVARDSMNYPLSEGLLKTLAEINRGKSAGEQIEVRSFGFNYKTIAEGGYENPQKIPLRDLVALNAPIQEPWYSHTYLNMQPWLQDTFELFHDSAGLGALTFSSPFNGSMFLTPKEQKRLAELDGPITRKFTEEELRLREIESRQLRNKAESAVKNAYGSFVSGLGVATTVKSGAYTKGGDFEPLPGDVILNGRAADELAPHLVGTRYEGRIVKMDVEWMMIGHVDEVVSIVPSEDVCGFAVLTFDSELGLELLRKEAPVGLEKVIPAMYHAPKFPQLFGYVKPDLAALYDHVVRKRPATKETKALLEVQKLAAERVRKEIAGFKKAYARLNPACTDLKVVTLPTLIRSHALEGDDPLASCMTMVPNPVNSLILGRDVLMPDPYLPTFREEIRGKMKELKLELHFQDAGFFHAHGGGVHCASNVIREPAR